MFHFGACPDHFAGAFVAEAVLGLHFEATDAACVPEVDVRAMRDLVSEDVVVVINSVLTRKCRCIARGLCIRRASDPALATRP